MMKLAIADDLSGLRGMIEAKEALYPLHWGAPVGRLNLRCATLAAVTKNRMRVVRYLCGESSHIECCSLHCSYFMLFKKKHEPTSPMRDAGSRESRW